MGPILLKILSGVLGCCGGLSLSYQWSSFCTRSYYWSQVCQIEKRMRGKFSNLSKTISSHSQCNPIKWKWHFFAAKAEFEGILVHPWFSECPFKSQLPCCKKNKWHVESMGKHSGWQPQLSLSWQWASTARSGRELLWRSTEESYLMTLASASLRALQLLRVYLQTHKSWQSTLLRY